MDEPSGGCLPVPGSSNMFRLRIPLRRGLSATKWLCCCLLSVALPSVAIATTFETAFGLGREHVVSGFVGDDVILPCDVDVASCGKVYFITWTKNVSSEWQRVYLFSETYERAIGDLTKPERASFSVSNDSAQLRIHGITVADEGTYKCDVTYVHGKCPSLSFTKLYTLVVPGEPQIRVNGKEVAKGTKLGPYQEDGLVALECKSVGGRPTPEVRWWNGTHQLRGKTTVATDGEDTTIVTSTVRFILSRWDLGAKLECRVESNATVVPLTTWVQLDIQVSPLALRVRGPLTPVVAGEMVSLTCTVEGARPAANITWYNRSEVVVPHPVSSTDEMSEGTFRTTSTLVFIASRHDHQADFFCKGTNQVLQNKHEAPLLQATRLEVLYPPAVHVKPSGRVAVNESGTTNITCAFDANPPNVTEIMWYKDGEPLVRNDAWRLEMKVVPVPTLVFHSASRNDSGSYSCHLKNAFGRGNATNSVYLDTLYPPVVQLRLSSNQLREFSTSSVSFTCETIDGNPRELSAVRWFQNGELFSETAVAHMTLDHVNRSHAANYSCQGRNEADWSVHSAQQALVVQYLPGNAKVIQLEEVAVKGQPVTLACQVDDLGNPPATSYRWEFNATPLPSNGSVLETEPITVATQGMYSCAAFNDVGTGSYGYFELKAKAPPSFIQRLPGTGGALKNSSGISLSCRVECDPLCEIEWFRNNDSLKDSKFFETKTVIQAQDVAHNLFTSVTSVLSWSMSYLPSSSIDYNNFSCRSSGNDLGPGVTSTMVFRVEYPPENVEISITNLDIMEGETPQDLVCSSSAHPSGDYHWTSGDRVISWGPVLSFNSSISREKAGNYTCVVSNRHGRATADTIITVLHAPECRMYEDFLDGGQLALTCEARGTPPVQNFTWFRNNVTVSEVTVRSEPAKSLLMVAEETAVSEGIYTCVAANAVGISEPCRLEISRFPSPSGWVQLLLQEENLLIVAAVAGGVVFVALLLLVSIAAVVVRRRIRGSNKPPLEERQNPEGRDRASEDTPLRDSPLLSPTKPDGSPLLGYDGAGGDCEDRDNTYAVIDGCFNKLENNVEKVG